MLALGGRLMEKGPPVWVSDPHGLPLEEGVDTHVDMLWFASDGAERSAKLKDALEGEERQTMWDEHQMLFKALQEGEAAEAAAEGKGEGKGEEGV